MAAAFSLLATAVSGTFAVGLLLRYVRGRHRAGWRRLALRSWGLSLAMFCVASGAMAVGTLAGWTSTTLRIFYLFGAVLNVPWLALGSVQVNAGDRTVVRAAGVAAAAAAALSGVLLTAAGATPGLVFVLGVALGGLWALVLAGPAPARATEVLVLLLTGAALPVVLDAELLGALPATGLPEGSELFGGLPRGLAFAGNTVGASIVVVAAVASALAIGWRSASEDRRARVGALRHGSLVSWVHAAAEAALLGLEARRGHLGHLVSGNLLIALGVLLAGAGGAFSFLGETAGNAVGLGLGVSVMYAGFVRTARPRGSGAAGRGSVPSASTTAPTRGWSVPERGPTPAEPDPWP